MTTYFCVEFETKFYIIPKYLFKNLDIIQNVYHGELRQKDINKIIIDNNTNLIVEALSLYHLQNFQTLSEDENLFKYAHLSEKILISVKDFIDKILLENVKNVKKTDNIQNLLTIKV